MARTPIITLITEFIAQMKAAGAQRVGLNVKCTPEDFLPNVHVVNDGVRLMQHVVIPDTIENTIILHAQAGDFFASVAVFAL